MSAIERTRYHSGGANKQQTKTLHVARTQHRDRDGTLHDDFSLFSNNINRALDGSSQATRQMVQTCGTSSKYGHGIGVDSKYCSCIE